MTQEDIERLEFALRDIKDAITASIALGRKLDLELALEQINIALDEE
jgi:hypothetical protein